MSTDEIKLLKLGDYVKRYVPNHSDEYYMITALGAEFKLRKVGSREILTTEDLEEFVRVDTSRK